MQQHTVYDLTDLKPGYLEVRQVQPQMWASQVRVALRHKLPHVETLLTLHFSGVRSVQWMVVKPEVPDDTPAQMLTHDVGESGYKRTARFATTVGEVIINYDRVRVEMHV